MGREGDERGVIRSREGYVCRGYRSKSPWEGTTQGLIAVSYLDQDHLPLKAPQSGNLRSTKLKVRNEIRTNQSQFIRVLSLVLISLKQQNTCTLFCF